MKFRNCRLQERLAASGFRNTQPRRIILDILSRTTHHLSAEDVYFLVRSINPSIGFATVYRTLDLLTRMNIVQKFDFGEGKARYELISNDKKNLHHHFICAKCRKITNYDTFLQEEEELIKKMREVFLKKHNFKIDNHIIYFHGICDNCSKEE